MDFTGYRKIASTCPISMSMLDSRPATRSQYYSSLAYCEGKTGLMLRAMVAVLLILWLLGFSFHVLGGLIHSFIIVAIIVFVIDLAKRR